MTSVDKLLSAMRSNPRADFRIEDFRRVAERFGVDCREPGGSHVIFRKAGIDIHLSVPARRPVKPIYVRQFVAFIDAVMGAGE